MHSDRRRILRHLTSLHAASLGTLCEILPAVHRRGPNFGPRAHSALRGTEGLERITWKWPHVIEGLLKVDYIRRPFPLQVAMALRRVLPAPAGEWRERLATD